MLYDDTIKIIVIGDEGVENTSLIIKFISGFFIDDLKLTIGVDFYSKTTNVNEKKVKLQIWDFGGEERFRFLLHQYYKGARGGLFVFDIADSSSIAHIDDWLSEIRKEIRTEDKFPIMLVGILPDEKSERQVSAEEGKKIANSRNLSGYIECNLKTGENVEKVFDELIRLILANEEYQTPIKIKKYEEFIVHDLKEEKEKIKEKILKISVPESLERQNLILGHKLYGVLDRFLELERLTKEQKLLIANIQIISNIQINPSKKKIYLRLFLDRFPDLSDQDKKDIIQSIEDEWDGKIDDDDYIPFPYIFNPPEPPDDLALAPRVQLHASPKKKDSEEIIDCQYCGMKLTKEEQLTHSCQKKPE